MYVDVKVAANKAIFPASLSVLTTTAQHNSIILFHIRLFLSYLSILVLLQRGYRALNQEVRLQNVNLMIFLHRIIQYVT